MTAAENTGIPGGARGVWVLAATILASSMAFIDGTVVNVALPAIQAAFHASTNQLQWVVEAYALFLSALLLVGGSLGDLYGRRRVFAAGTCLFAAGSAWCGFAQTLDGLVFARGVQGIGAALLVPGSLSLLTTSFSEEDRGQAIGTWSGFSAMTTAVGPLLGGWLVDHASWRWVFFINLPIAVCVLALTYWRVPESQNPASARRLDWAGAGLITLSLGAITIGLVDGPQYRHLLLYSCLVGGAAFLAFVVLESRVAAPMLPLGLFRSRTFVVANAITLLLYTALSGMLFFLPLNLIQVQHYTASESGAALVPLIVTIFVLSRWSGGLIASMGARLPLTVGPAIAALGFLLAARPGIGGSYWGTFFPAIFVLGLGMAVTVAPLTTAVMNAVPLAEAGTASGINNAVSRVAGLLAVAVFGLVMLASFEHDLTLRLDRAHLQAAEKLRMEGQYARLAAIEVTDAGEKADVAEAFVHGFRRLMWLAAGLSLASALTAQALERKKAVRDCGPLLPGGRHPC